MTNDTKIFVTIFSGLMLIAFIKVRQQVKEDSQRYKQ
mgnify:CR=1 FL=1